MDFPVFVMNWGVEAQRYKASSADFEPYAEELRELIADLRRNPEGVEFRLPGLAPVTFALGAPPQFEITSQTDRMISVGTPGGGMWQCNWIFRPGEVTKQDAFVMSEMITASLPPPQGPDPNAVALFTLYCHQHAPCMVTTLLDRSAPTEQIDVARVFGTMLGGLLLSEPVKGKKRFFRAA